MNFNFNGLTPEMFQHCVLPFLGNNDLFRMRRVCRSWKENVDDFLRIIAKSSKTFYIAKAEDFVTFSNDDGSWKHFEYMKMEEFLGLVLPLQPRHFNFNFYLDHEFFNDQEWQLSRFLDDHGSYLTSLSLPNITLPLDCATAHNFFNRIAASIRFLSIGAIYIGEFVGGQQRPTPPFQNVTTLEVQHLYVNNGTELADLEYFWEVIRNCTSLENFTFPSTLLFDNEEFYDGPPNLNLGYEHLGYHHLGFLRERSFLNNLKSYDLFNVAWFEADFPGEGTFPRLCSIMHQHQVRLENVNCGCLKGISDQQMETFGSAIYSMRDYNLKFGRTQFPRMKRLEINVGSIQAGDGDHDAILHVPEWPSLKTLLLTINSNFMDFSVDSRRLFDFLFGGETRPSLETLNLDRYECDEDPVLYRLPSFLDIAKTCVNVTTITLQHWVASDADYANLWKGLMKLESITFLDCRNIGVEAFTGGNDQEPVFLQLKNLKKLRFIMVQNMWKINDQLFKDVFRHLPLKEFVLDSSRSYFLNTIEEVTSFTKDGIDSLMTSHFANSIQTFPLSSFRLKGYTAENMSVIGKSFRCSDMV